MLLSASFATRCDEGLQADVGAQTADRTGNVVREVALEYPEDAASVVGCHVRGQPAAVVGLPDQRKPVGAERLASVGPARVPSVHVALAPVSEVHGGPTVRAQDDYLVGLRAQVDDCALRAPLPEVARVNLVHPVASQIRQVQGAAARSPTPRQSDIKHVPPVGAVVRDRLRQHHPITAVRRHLPHDHRPRGCIRHVHKHPPVIPVVSRDVV